jgi:hypothetical protein
MLKKKNMTYIKNPQLIPASFGLNKMAGVGLPDLKEDIKIKF